MSSFLWQTLQLGSRVFNPYIVGLGNTSSCAFVSETNELWISGGSLSDRHFVHDAFTGREIAQLPQPTGAFSKWYGLVSYDKYANVVAFHTDNFEPRAILYDPISRAALTGVLTLTSANNASSVLAFSPFDLGSLMWAGAYNTTAPISVYELPNSSIIRELPNLPIIGAQTYEQFIKFVGEIPNLTTFRNMFYDETRELMIVVNSI
jgi:hypothetical protein